MRSLVCVVLVGTACASENATLEQPAGDEPAAPLVEPGGNLGDSVVETTLASMPLLRTSDAVKHVFQRADGVVPERFYLHHFASDEQGTQVHFEIDYLDEKSTFDLSGRVGFISISRNGVQSLATAGTVTVAETDEHISVQFSGLRIAEVRDGDERLSESVALGDGSVVGDVKRVCVVSSNTSPPNTELDPSVRPIINGGPQIDPTWTHEFCARYASASAN